MKHKVGDVVRVKSYGWYCNEKDGYGRIRIKRIFFNSEMSKSCGRLYQIREIHPDGYYCLEGLDWKWIDEMFEDTCESHDFGLDDIQTRIDGRMRLSEALERMKWYRCSPPPMPRNPHTVDYEMRDDETDNKTDLIGHDLLNIKQLNV